MGAIASQITSLKIVFSGADQRKYQSFASLAFLRGINRWPMNYPYKGPVTRKMFPFDDVIMKIVAFVSRPQWTIFQISVPYLAVFRYVVRTHYTCIHVISGPSRIFSIVAKHLDHDTTTAAQDHICRKRTACNEMIVNKKALLNYRIFVYFRVWMVIMVLGCFPTIKFILWTYGFL